MASAKGSNALASLTKLGNRWASDESEVVLDAEALAWEHVDALLGQEFARKVKVILQVREHGSVDADLKEGFVEKQKGGGKQTEKE